LGKDGAFKDFSVLIGDFYKESGEGIAQKKWFPLK